MTDRSIIQSNKFGPKPPSRGFWEATWICYRKYASSSGRASRSEFWYFQLFCTLVNCIIHVAIYLASKSETLVGILYTLNAVFFLGTLIPAIAVTNRRLHDIGRSGSWQLILFTGVGYILLIYWLCKKSSDSGSEIENSNNKMQNSTYENISYASSYTTKIDAIERLSKLKEAGILTIDEFESEKKKILQ